MTISEQDFGDEYHMVRLREYNDARYEHVSGVDVTPSGLKVVVAGLYFVYKSIFFVPDSSHPCKHFKEQVHKIDMTHNNIALFVGTICTGLSRAAEFYLILCVEEILLLHTLTDLTFAVLWSPESESDCELTNLTQHLSFCLEPLY